jgi:hypothetical protein
MSEQAPTLRDQVQQVVEEMRQASGQFAGVSPYFVGRWADTLAALLAQHEQDGWQPIATAPKDGADVMTFGGAGMVVARYEDEAWRLYNYGYEEATVRKQPTHWRPLPNPPKAQP